MGFITFFFFYSEVILGIRVGNIQCENYVLIPLRVPLISPTNLQNAYCELFVTKALCFLQSVDSKYSHTSAAINYWLQVIITSSTVRPSRLRLKQGDSQVIYSSPWRYKYVGLKRIDALTVVPWTMPCGPI